MDLSKAFVTLNRNLLVAKLKAYGLNLNAALFIKSYLTNRYQRCKIGDSFSEQEIIIAGVPQGSMLGPLPFNIFINNIFLYIENSGLCNYADDSTLYASGESLYMIIENLKPVMILNPDKYHFMVLSDSNCTYNCTWNGTTIESSKE